MDGPTSGPPDAWAKLAALNPPPAAAPSAAASEKTFVLLRPAAVRGALVSEISKRFERRGFALAAMRLLKPGAELAAQHYAPRGASRSALAELASQIQPGPVMAMLWQGAGVIAGVLALVGAEDPAAADPGTVRGDLSAADEGDTLLECAADAADVARLTALWFEEADLAAGPHSAALATAPPPLAAAPAAAQRKPAARPLAAGERFYITTAINYANGAPHMGHAYEAVAADVLARYHRAYGREVRFCTGSDEHGQKIADTAAGLGLTPQALADKCTSRFKHLDKTLHCDYDVYVRTTSEKHKKQCRALWQKAVDRGGVYLGEYEGWYNVREEAFVQETEAQLNDYKDPVSGLPLKKMKEASYFFRLSEYGQKLIEHIDANPQFIQPEERRNEVLGRL
jgi:nucleoside diphosphate kinase